MVVSFFVLFCFVFSVIFFLFVNHPTKDFVLSFRWGGGLVFTRSSRWLSAKKDTEIRERKNEKKNAKCLKTLYKALIKVGGINEDILMSGNGEL